MKYLLTLVISLFTLVAFGQTDSLAHGRNGQQILSELYAGVGPARLPEPFLMDKAFILEDPDNHNGTTTNSTITTWHWKQLYSQFYYAQMQSNLLNPIDTIDSIAIVKSNHLAARIPIGAFFFRYSQIVPNAFTDSMLHYDDTVIADGPDLISSPYIVKTCFAASPLVEQVYIGATIARREWKWPGTIQNSGCNGCASQKLPVKS